MRSIRSRGGLCRRTAIRLLRRFMNSRTAEISPQPVSPERHPHNSGGSLLNDQPPLTQWRIKPTSKATRRWFCASLERQRGSPLLPLDSNRPLSCAICERLRFGVSERVFLLFVCRSWECQSQGTIGDPKVCDQGSIPCYRCL